MPRRRGIQSQSKPCVLETGELKSLIFDGWLALLANYSSNGKMQHGPDTMDQPVMVESISLQL